SPATHQVFEPLLLLSSEELIWPVVLDDNQCATFLGRQQRRQRIQSTSDRLGHGLARSCNGAIDRAAPRRGFRKNGDFCHNVVFLLRILLKAQGDGKTANELVGTQLIIHLNLEKNRRGITAIFK